MMHEAGSRSFRMVLIQTCEKMLQQLAEEYQFRILAMEVMPDHVHLLLDRRPQFRISDMVKILKGNTARWLFSRRS